MKDKETCLATILKVRLRLVQKEHSQVVVILLYLRLESDSKPTLEKGFFITHFIIFCQIFFTTLDDFFIKIEHYSVTS